jgi:BlaI family transcriptional regulator, penicillinase repressor
MLGKKLVKRYDGKRGYVWSARASRTRTASDLVRKVLDHVFDGSAGRLVAHLLEEKELDRRDRDEIRKLLEAFEASEVGNQGDRPP